MVVCSTEKVSPTLGGNLGSQKKPLQHVTSFLCDAHLQQMWKSFRTTSSAGAHGRRKADRASVEELEQRQKEARELLPPDPSSPGAPMQGCDEFIYTRAEVLWEDGGARCEDQAGQAGFACNVVSLARHLG